MFIPFQPTNKPTNHHKNFPPQTTSLRTAGGTKCRRKMAWTQTFRERRGGGKPSIWRQLRFQPCHLCESFHWIVQACNSGGGKPCSWSGTMRSGRYIRICKHISDHHRGGVYDFCLLSWNPARTTKRKNAPTHLQRNFEATMLNHQQISSSTVPPTKREFCKFLLVKIKVPLITKPPWAVR